MNNARISQCGAWCNNCGKSVADALGTPPPECFTVDPRGATLPVRSSPPPPPEGSDEPEAELCLWAKGLELLCGDKCAEKGDPALPDRQWCSAYDNSPDMCDHSFVQRDDGTYSRCRHNGARCHIVPPWAGGTDKFEFLCGKDCNLGNNCNPVAGMLQSSCKQEEWCSKHDGDPTACDTSFVMNLNNTFAVPARSVAQIAGTIREGGVRVAQRPREPAPPQPARLVLGVRRRRGEVPPLVRDDRE